jgi:hypothetical protein
MVNGRWTECHTKVNRPCDAPRNSPARSTRSAVRLRRAALRGRYCPKEQPWVIADGALRTLGFDGALAKLHKLTAERLRFADTVQV